MEKEMEKKAPEGDIEKMLLETGYSEKAVSYFKSREKTGILKNADQITDLIGPCGDKMKISLSIEDGAIDDAKIEVLGCPGAIASGCALVSLAKGKSLLEAKGIDLDALYAELEKMPEQKIHCARLAIKTLQKAVDQYLEKIDNN